MAVKYMWIFSPAFLLNATLQWSLRLKASKLNKYQWHLSEEIR